MKAKKAVSFGLSAVMLAGIVAPATALAADTKTIEIYYNDADYPARRYREAAGTEIKDLELYKQGASSLASVKVESGEYLHEETESIDGMHGTLPNGSEYTLDLQSTGSSDALYLSVPVLSDDMRIYLNTEAASYVVVGNSGELGSNQNYGNDNTPTCSVEGSGVTVEGGQRASLTFTPNDGLQIKKLNIRTGYSNQEHLVDASTGSVTIDGVSYQITKAEDGKVTVSSVMTNDLFVTALTTQEAALYDLTVETDENITANVETGTISSDEKSKVVFTPDTGYSIYKFIITDGGKSKTLYATDSSVDIGNKTYTLNKELNGRITVNIPEATADVKIEAISSEGSYYVDVKDSKYVESNFDDPTWIGDGEEATVVLTPVDDYEITNIEISIGDATTTVSSNENGFSLAGRNYRMEKMRDGEVYIYLRDLKANVLIDPTVRDTTNKLTVRCDDGVFCEDEGTVRVSDGDVYQLTFEPEDDCTIEEIKVVRSGRSYVADRGDKYLTINGERCPINWMANGNVVITLYDIDADMTVDVSSDYVSGNRYIYKRADAHSEISHDADHSNYAEPGEKVTVTVEPDDGYHLTEVEIETDDDSVTINQNTVRFVLNNRAYYVTHRSDGSWDIVFSSLPASITVRTETEKGDYNGGTTNQPVAGAQQYHAAYITGVGSNRFDPDRNMTRAEAVVLLARLYYGVDANDMYSYDSSFYDSINNSWYDGYLGWAQDMGLIDYSNGYFRPNAYITRAEFLDMLIRFSGANTTGYSGYTTGFYDLSNAWIAQNPVYASEIAFSVAQGWINGYPDGTFRPNALICRSEVVTMVNRVVGRDPDEQTIFVYSNTLNNFADVPVNHWAYYDIMEAANGHTANYNRYGVETWSNFR